MKPRTTYDKIWDDHLVDQQPDGTCLLYIDRHLVHEVTSPQAFEGLRLAGRKVHAPEKTLLVVDHNVPTTDRSKPNPDPESAEQIATLAQNAKDFGLEYYDEFDKRQGIVHIIGPEQGFTLPGTTIVCGDSHTSTHGAFGALAFGIGTSEVEHVLATQTLVQRKPKTMRINYTGALPEGVSAKDMILATIGRLGTGGMVGYVVEFAGETVRDLSMEARMTICNMTIEGGGRAGMIAPDETTFDYVRGRPGAPDDFDAAVAEWRQLATDDGAEFDTEIDVDATTLSPMVTWGTNPGMVTEVAARVPDPAALEGPVDAETAERALAYMALEPGTPITEIELDRVFIGSCTNSRIEDLRAAAAMVVPGSEQVRHAAEQEGLHEVFREAGFEWRASGCSMCLGMNPDILIEGERCASTSNRNFEGRQGKGGRTHLVSPAVAAATAIVGTFATPADLG